MRSGRCGVLEAGSFEELSAALVKARIAARLSKKELSDRLNLKEQQIQRYEATNYRSASLARLQQVAKALGVEVHVSLLLGAEIHEFEKEKGMTFITTAERMGLEKGLAEGLEKGLAEGLEKGLAEGLEKGREEGLLAGIELGGSPRGRHD